MHFRSIFISISLGTDTVIVMDWPALWTSVLASSGAAVIGLTSAVLVFQRTRAADRRDSAENHRRQRIAMLHAALWGDLAPRLANRWRPIGTAALPLAKALAEVMVGELAEHPPVALWVNERSEEFSKRLRSAERGWLLFGDKARRKRLIHTASTTVSMLMAWDAGAVEESWFAARLSEENTKALQAPRLRKRSRRRR